jgi:hypothetical protein
MVEILEGLLIVAPATILVVEFFLACPLLRLVRAMSEQTRKAVRVLGMARVSDHWKEKVLPVYALATMKTSLLLGGWILLLLGVFTVALHVSGQLWSAEFDGMKALQRVDYMLYAVLVASAHVFVRRFVRHA